MVHVDEAAREEYRGAWEAWRKHLDGLHEVFLDGEELDPPRLKGLLNREARAKDRYDAARLALLGIPSGVAAPGGGGFEAPRPPGPPR